MNFAIEETLAIGKIPSGLFIIATENEGKIDGFLASFIQQVSMEPLLLTIAIKPGRPAYDSIMKGNTFTINIAGDHDKSYMKLFWKGYDENDNPFDKLDFARSKNNGIVMQQALTSIDCKLLSSSKPGDHELVIAQVLECHPINDDGKPITHIRKNGMSY